MIRRSGYGIIKISQELMDTIASYMDDDIREDLHGDLAPCKPEEFLVAYAKRDENFEELLSNEFRIEIVDESSVTKEDLFLGAEQNEDFYNWLEDRNVTGDELAALIWACPSWDWLDGWYEKIEYWFDKPVYDDTDLNVAWYNDFNCENYMDVIVDLYKEYLDFDENNA